jgi:hypothetical protein
VLSADNLSVCPISPNHEVCHIFASLYVHI